MEKQPRFTNRLAKETSPYLLQHAHNPVNWYPWGEEALTKAKTENKPILVSIGYAACHWCHVMEHESFENEEVAAFMNAHFVNIKIDREERPDIDHIYMEAIQVMTGAGGWPLNVFLTPDKKPFYGGTYFPPVPAHGRASWMQILEGVSRAFNEKRDDIEEQGESLTKHIASQDFFSANNKEEPQLNKQLPEAAFKNLQPSFDKQEGGFGNAPKFPGTFCINFLLRHFYYTGNKEALTHARLSLEKMCMGGIYDHLGGGFARYSTDRKWLVPHFEKMLYDNALLVNSLSDAFKLTGSKFYADTIRHTLYFVQRDLMNKEGGFYASLDADSEGVEGKFYTWDKKEIQDLLRTDADLFCEFCNVTAEGNWEENNILHQTIFIEEFARQKNLPVEQVEKTLSQSRHILWQAREKRVHPGLDDKIILSWNAMMCSAFVDAYAAIGDDEFLKVAEQNLSFVLNAFRKKDGKSFYHNYKNGTGFNFALLDDYALIIKALMDVYEVNFDKKLIRLADEITGYVLKHFFDKTDGMFFYSSDEQTDLLLRKKEFFDGALPSGNSVMATNLNRLSILLDNRNYTAIVEQMLLTVAGMATKYPSSFANWLCLINDYAEGTKEVAIIGGKHKNFAVEINRLFIPNKIIMADNKGDNSFPLLAGKDSNNETLIYVCKNYACQLPANSVEAFKKSHYLPL